VSCRVLIVAVIAAAVATCSSPSGEPEIRLVLAGQALIKKDPRIRWDDAYGTLRPILERADVAFTNFEMAVLPGVDQCGVPSDYEVSLGTPRLPEAGRPGNSGGPHAVAPEVMDFLADLGFNLMSLSNNHAWDLGDCGAAATRAAAEASGVAHAGTGRDLSEASAPGYLTVGDFTMALVAATTSHDERSAIGHAVNGVWTGRQEDWDRNLAAVRDAAANADFVLYYQHFQLDLDEFREVSPGDTTGDGHAWIDDVAKWQSDFAHAVLDAGASMYVGHGHRAFDGVEVYHGKPLLRQLGGFAYQGLNPVIGSYDEHRPWEGLIAEVIVREGRAVRLEFTPLDLDEGDTYRLDYGDLEFLSRRGLAQLATGPQANSILRRLSDLSAGYGAELEVSSSQATLEIGPGN
jgi:poly-gamma-glutamate synthesis protein (capsule biosynthesis protein)